MNDKEQLQKVTEILEGSRVNREHTITNEMTPTRKVIVLIELYEQALARLEKRCEEKDLIIIKLARSLP